MNVTTEVLVALGAVLSVALLGGLAMRYAGQAAAARPIVEADRMRTMLLAAVSHDLRTPLAAGQGRGQLSAFGQHPADRRGSWRTPGHRR
jgi:K+-sensing histidine kinase KdpD